MDVNVSSLPCCVLDMILRGSSDGFKSQNAKKSSGISSYTYCRKLPAPRLCSSTEPASLYSIVHLKSCVSTTRGVSYMYAKGSYMTIIGQSFRSINSHSIVLFFTAKKFHGSYVSIFRRVVDATVSTSSFYGAGARVLPDLQFLF